MVYIKVFRFLLAMMLASCCFFATGQDHLRIGMAADFNSKGKLVQTISFDLNRTELVDEKAGNYWLFKENGFFIQPSADVNIGEKTSSADNNITVLLNFGKVFLGESKKVSWSKSLELNPTYSSDKNFEEKLAYGQIKAAIGIVADQDGVGFIKRTFSASAGLFGNLGGRTSKLLDDRGFYAAAGPLAELQMVWRKIPKDPADGTDPYTNWQVKLSGKGYYLFSELSALYDKNVAGSLKASVDKKFVKFFYLGLAYKYGNDNPTYKNVHTLELGLKFNYTKPKG